MAQEWRLHIKNFNHVYEHDGNIESKEWNHLCQLDLFVCYRKTLPRKDKTLNQ